MSRAKRRTCLLCEDPARAFETDYEHAETEPVFCTRRCALAWALIEVRLKSDNDEIHFCETERKWAFDRFSCRHCPDPYDQKAAGGHTGGQGES